MAYQKCQQNRVQFTKYMNNTIISINNIMLRLLTQQSRYLARTNKSTKINFEQIRQDREILIKHVRPFYTESDRPHDDRVYEQKLYGRKCNIVGLTPDSELSTTYISSVFQALNPDLVIMGGFNNSRIISQNMVKSVQQKRAVRAYDNIIQPAKLYCKSLVTPIVSRILDQNANYVKDQKTQSIYFYDHVNKHVHALNYLTIINRVMMREYCKLTFGTPSDYIVFEDIMINQSIGSLRDAFQRVFNATIQQRYQVKSVKYFPDFILEQLRYNAVNQPALNTKQITYATALLHKSISVCERVVLFVENQYVHRIADNVHKIKIDPKQVYRGGYTDPIQNYTIDKNSQSGTKANLYLNAENKDQAISQLLQKLVILNLLKNNTLQTQLIKNDQNIFQNMIFSKLFEHLTTEQIKQRYKIVKKPYQDKLSQIIKLRIKNVMWFKQSQKNFYTLTEMIKTQQQRNLDFPINLQVQNKNTLAQSKIDIQQITNQMEKIIKNQLTHTQKQLIQSHKNQQMTRQSIVLYQKILVKAKLRLGKSDVKLPVFHYGALSGIFKDIIKDQLSNKLTYNGSKKQQKKVLLENIQKLKQKGVIRQLQSMQELQKFQQQIGEQSRISLDIDENGELTLHDDGNNNEQQLQKLIKNSQIFKDLFQMTQKTKQQEQFLQDKEQDQQRKPVSKSGANSIKKGRKKNFK